MNKKSIQWLYDELPKLEGLGVLTPETSAKIRQHYGEIKNTRGLPVILLICGVLGAILIGLGIILLFAHNWEEFSRSTRAAISFAPSILAQGLAFWVLWKRPNSGAFKEGAATFLSLMVGASIALISQTYHIPDATGTFVLTWMFLILPLVYLMQASLPAAIYLIGITSWCAGHAEDPLQAVLFWPLSGAVIPHFLWTLRREIYTIRSTILSLLLMICLSMAAAFSLGRTLGSFWIIIIIIPSLYTIFYSLGTWPLKDITTNWQKPFRILGGLGLFVLAFLFTFRQFWLFVEEGSRTGRGMDHFTALPDYLITLTIVTTAVVFFYKHIKQKNWMVSFWTAMPLLAIFGYSFSDGAASFVPMIMFNIYLLALSVTYIRAGVLQNSIPAVNQGMLMLAALIMVRFFDSDINFILKGLVFIVIGMGFLSANIWLMRRRGAMS